MRCPLEELETYPSISKWLWQQTDQLTIFPISEKFRTAEEELAMAIFPPPRPAPDSHEIQYISPFTPVKAFDLSWEKIISQGVCSEQTAKPCLIGVYSNLQQRKQVYQYFSQLVTLGDKLDTFGLWRGELTPGCTHILQTTTPKYIFLNTRRRKFVDLGWKRGGLDWKKFLGSSTAPVAKKTGDLKGFVEALISESDKNKFLQNLERDFRFFFRECYLSFAIQNPRQNK